MKEKEKETYMYLVNENTKLQFERKREMRLTTGGGNDLSRPRSSHRRPFPHIENEFGRTD